MAVCRVERIERLQRSKDRAVAFLVCDDEDEIDAKKTFDALPEKRQREVRDRFDYWLQHGKHNKYFHGWDYDPYKDCFVFKWKEKRQHQRLYGFLVHPCPKNNPRLEVCVLVSYAQKNSEDTDPSELNGALTLSQRLDIIKAVKAEFPDIKENDQ